MMSTMSEFERKARLLMLGKWDCEKSTIGLSTQESVDLIDAEGSWVGSIKLMSEKHPDYIQYLERQLVNCHFEKPEEDLFLFIGKDEKHIQDFIDHMLIEGFKLIKSPTLSSMYPSTLELAKKLGVNFNEETYYGYTTCEQSVAVNGYDEFAFYELSIRIDDTVVSIVD